MADNVPITPGSGTSIASKDVGGVQHQKFIICDPTTPANMVVVDSAGRQEVKVAQGLSQTWTIQSTFSALAGNKLFFDLFNATGSGKIIRVHRIFLQKDMSAQTGVAVRFDLHFTTAVGTGGTVLTPVSLDSANTALPAQITARTAAAGGATLGSLIHSRFYHSEETNVAAQMQEAFPFWPPGFPDDQHLQDITLRENQGLTLKQITATTAGVYNASVLFTVQ